MQFRCPKSSLKAKEQESQLSLKAKDQINQQSLKADLQYHKLPVELSWVKSQRSKMFGSVTLNLALGDAGKG